MIIRIISIVMCTIVFLLCGCTDNATDVSNGTIVKKTIIIDAGHDG